MQLLPELINKPIVILREIVLDTREFSQADNGCVFLLQTPKSRSISAQ